MSKVVCLHGPESVGKSVLADALALALDGESVPEYGRDYCMTHGTDLGMPDLLAIARMQTDLIEAARRRHPNWVIADTDALMTAVWADMMLDKRDPWFERFDAFADLYLLLDIDLPFIDDGLRLYGGTAERRRFYDLCRAELERRGVPYAVVSGTGDTRLQRALAAIRATLGA